jgi:hypothetical protein
VPSLPVKPQFGPTLPALLAPRWRRASRPVRLAVAAVGAVVLLLALVTVVRGGPGAANETTVVVDTPPGFNLRHGEALARVDPRPAELLRLEGRRGELFLQSFAVTPLLLAPYRGLPGGTYPVAAERLKERLAARFPEFELVEEGRTRINEVPGYEVVFRAHDRVSQRRLYGRFVMLVPLTEPPTPQRRGFVLELLATPASGVPNAGLVGDQGQLKLPLRSFRFGTDPP